MRADEDDEEREHKRNKSQTDSSSHMEFIDPLSGSATTVEVSISLTYSCQYEGCACETPFACVHHVGTPVAYMHTYCMFHGHLCIHDWKMQKMLEIFWHSEGSEVSARKLM
jgi:hypothetical protein